VHDRPSLCLAAVLLVGTVTGCDLAYRSKAAPSVVPAAGKEGNSELELLGATNMTLAGPEDAIVRVVGPQMTCSGTLVAEDMVLTAHHCVVQRVGPTAAFSKTLVSSEKLNIELGGDYLPWATVGVKAVVAPPCGEAGGKGDVAVLVLERRLIGMYTMTARLKEPPARGEHVDPAGFGRCALSANGIRRRAREGGEVVAMSSGTFDVRASICPGDSGGPLVVRNGSGSPEVVGVVSLSAMDGDDTTRNLSVMARIDSFRSVFGHARLIADGADASDLPPLSCDR
jgi:hypothetical protein